MLKEIVKTTQITPPQRRSNQTLLNQESYQPFEDGPIMR